jgi:hypothetical protein
MFDVYLNLKQDRLLVIARGQPIPVIENAGQWRKKRGTVAISHEINCAVQRDGFYCRRLRNRNLLPAPRMRAASTSEAQATQCSSLMP